MKAEYGELKDRYGEIRLFPESIDDLWHLRHLITTGDLVFATTFRSVDTASDKIRPEKAEKRPVRLGIRIDRVEFSEHGIRLRLTGVIEHGVDTGAYHTINVETGFEISVIKQWRPIDLERVERAVKASVYGVIHILTMEEGEAELFRLRQYRSGKCNHDHLGKRQRLGNRYPGWFFWTGACHYRRYHRPADCCRSRVHQGRFYTIRQKPVQYRVQIGRLLSRPGGSGVELSRK